ncbi:response regulator [Priestia megaterium]|uniref:response regulator n=1 Tax=Priestia megaterium TaxID=1404 RepID=UPI003BA35888
MSERTILIVDDEDEIRNLMSIYLKNEGYQVVDVPNAATAIDMLKKQKIDLIILDVMMTGMNGIDACLSATCC